MTEQQLDLFIPAHQLPAQTVLKARSRTLVMTRDRLEKWKKRIFLYQQSVLKLGQNQVQTSLFDLPKSYDLEVFNPFELRDVQSIEFWRFPDWRWSDENCLYFVIDFHLPLLLYVGETKRHPLKRWQNHDCVVYIQRYKEAHNQHQLPHQVRIAFHWDVPIARSARQAMELTLIQKWQSPFNKENWRHWGQPFGK